MRESTDFTISRGDQLLHPTTRRRFLGLLAAGGSILMLPSVFAACSDDDAITDPFTDPARYRLDLSSDAGILNYAYALEQLEAAFYTAALTSPGFDALSTAEQEVFQDLQKHEVIHRELLKQVLGTAALPDIGFSPGAVATRTASRDALLATAQLLEDTGVSAYNGAAKYLTTAANLLVAGKIVSVEARHAAAVRDVRDGTNGRLFAGDDVVNASGLDVKAEPDAVIDAVGALELLGTPVSIDTPPDETRRAQADAPAQGTLPTAIRNVLDFALMLKIFENELYKAVLGTSASAAQNAAFATVRAAVAAVPGAVSTLEQIQKQEAAQAAALIDAGATNVLGLDATTFDFTGARGAGNGPFAKATTDLAFLLQLVQAAEDTGVRAYKGQAALLMTQPARLETALRIHSVEARHASRIRRMRRAAAGAGAAVRYSGTVRGGAAGAAGATDLGPQPALVGAAFDAIYGAGANGSTAPSEANVIHAGVNVNTLNALTSALGPDAAQEAFDEPLGRADVVKIVQPFFIPTITATT